MSLGLDLYYADPAQPLTTAGEEPDDLDHDLPYVKQLIHKRPPDLWTKRVFDGKGGCSAGVGQFDIPQHKSYDRTRKKKEQKTNTLKKTLTQHTTKHNTT